VGYAEIMVVLAILILLVKLPFRIAVYLFHHKALLVLTGVLILGIFAWRTCSNVGNQATTTLPSYQQIAPTVDKAPYVIATSSRMYYVTDYTEDKGLITLKKYYLYDKKAWKFMTTPLVLDKKVYGDIRIYER
jgi:hypothetical protein